MNSFPSSFKVLATAVILLSLVAGCTTPHARLEGSPAEDKQDVLVERTLHMGASGRFALAGTSEGSIEITIQNETSHMRADGSIASAILVHTSDSVIGRHGGALLEKKGGDHVIAIQSPQAIAFRRDGNREENGPEDGFPDRLYWYSSLDWPLPIHDAPLLAFIHVFQHGFINASSTQGNFSWSQQIHSLGNESIAMVMAIRQGESLAIVYTFDDSPLPKTAYAEWETPAGKSRWNITRQEQDLGHGAEIKFSRDQPLAAPLVATTPIQEVEYPLGTLKIPPFEGALPGIEQALQIVQATGPQDPGYVMQFAWYRDFNLLVNPGGGPYDPTGTFRAMWEFTVIETPLPNEPAYFRRLFEHEVSNQNTWVIDTSEEQISVMGPAGYLPPSTPFVNLQAALERFKLPGEIHEVQWLDNAARGISNQYWILASDCLPGGEPSLVWVNAETGLAEYAYYWENFRGINACSPGIIPHE